MKRPAATTILRIQPAVGFNIEASVASESDLSGKEVTKKIMV